MRTQELQSQDEVETVNLENQDTDSVMWQDCSSKVSKLSPVESDAEFKTASEGDDDDDKVMSLFVRIEGVCDWRVRIRCVCIFVSELDIEISISEIYFCIFIYTCADRW